MARREEQSVIKTIQSHETPTPMKTPQTPSTEKEQIEVTGIESLDEALVKPLKMLAQICVDELNKCNEMTTKSEDLVEPENVTSVVVEVSSESDSDASSTRSSQRGIIVGGAKKRRCSESTCSSSSSSSSSGSGSSDESSSSESEDSTDDDDDNDNDSTVKIDDENVKLPIEETTVKNSNNDENENVVDSVKIIENDKDNDADQGVIAVQVKNQVEKSYSPTPLKDICRQILHENCIDILYEVPSLKYLCEHTLATAGMEIPLICFVNEEEQTYFVNDEQPAQGAEGEEEGVILCLNGEFDETELANLFNGAGAPTGNGACESLETASIEPIDTNAIDKSTLIDQCVALQNILSSPPPNADANTKNDFNSSENGDEIAYFMDTNAYTVGNQFHDSIQYEETVVPSDNNTDEFSVAVEFKKYLQKKYVQPSCYHKMFAINKLLRKYKVHQEATNTRKAHVQKQLQRRLFKTRQKQKEKLLKRMPKKIIATRRSARIAGKVKQQIDFTKFGKRSQKSTKTDMKLTDLIKGESIEEHKGEKKRTLADAEKETITRDILKLIAKKRTLKRKLSICHRPTFDFDDAYCYDEDGQISEMVSSFINNTIDGELAAAAAAAAKKRSPKNKEVISTTTTITPTTIAKKKKKSESTKKRTKIDGKLNKLLSKEKKSKKQKGQEKSSLSKWEKNALATIVSTSIGAKTDEKTVPPITLTIRTKAAVKEIVPAKRQRCLSIDDRSMTYGKDLMRSYNQIKPFTDDYDYPKIKRRKISQPKTWRKKDTPLKGETVENKSKRSKDPNEPECAKPKSVCVEPIKPTEVKNVIESSSRTVDTTTHNVKPLIQLDKEKPANKFSAIQTNGITNEAQPIVYPNPKKALIEKSERFMESSMEHFKPIQHPSEYSNQAIADNSEMKKPQPLPRQISNTTSTEQINTVSSTKNIEQQSPLLKSTTSKLWHRSGNAHRRISEGNLRSTMLSPLKIIIEPRRSPMCESPSSRDKSITPKDPLAIDTVDIDLTSPTNDDDSASSAVSRPTRFAEKFESFVEKSMGRDHVEKKPEHNRISMPASNQNALVESETIASSIKSYCDIETLLSSTKIPQLKPSKRCVTRAQTISLSESPYRAKSPESSNWRPMKEFFHQRKSPLVPQPKPQPNPIPTTSSTSQPVQCPKEPMIYQINSIGKTSNTAFTVTKRKPSMNAPLSTQYAFTGRKPPTQPPPKPSAPFERPPLDISTFPDPDSLQIPSIDLRSPSILQSPLFQMPGPFTNPIQMPSPLLKLPTETNEFALGKLKETHFI